MPLPSRFWPVVRWFAAGFVGYLVVALLTTLGFEVWLGGADLYGGGPLLQVKGGLVAVVAGLVGGGLAALLGRRRPILHALAPLPFLAVDTVYVLFFFGGTAPLWFDLAASLGLMAATVAGGALLAGLDRKLRSASPGSRN